MSNMSNKEIINHEKQDHNEYCEYCEASEKNEHEHYKDQEYEKSEAKHHKEEIKQTTSNENLKQLKQEVKKLQEELDQQKDIFLRTVAEYDNYRKRTEKEKSRIYVDAVSDVLTQILPITDNLERASAQKGNHFEALKQGLEMVNTQFEEVLKNLDVEKIGAIGDSFNPEIHNAVSHIEKEDFGKNTISEVFQKGYRIGEKVIRPAMVQVIN